MCFIPIHYPFSFLQILQFYYLFENWLNIQQNSRLVQKVKLSFRWPKKDHNHEWAVLKSFGRFFSRRLLFSNIRQKQTTKMRNFDFVFCCVQEGNFPRHQIFKNATRDRSVGWFPSGKTHENPNRTEMFSNVTANERQIPNSSFIFSFFSRLKCYSMSSLC